MEIAIAFIMFVVVMFAVCIFGAMPEMDQRYKRGTDFGTSMYESLSRAEKDMRKNGSYNPKESLQARVEVSKYIARRTNHQEMG